MIRTLIAEANPVARLGLRAILDEHEMALDIDEAGSRVALLASLRECDYEFIVVEPLLGGDDAALVKHLRALSPWSEILVYTALDELSFGVAAIRAGAKGYLMKTASRAELRDAVRRVAGGQPYLSRALAEEFAIGIRRHHPRAQPHEGFGKRELQVFALAVCGMTPIESAEILQLSTARIGVLRGGVMARLRLSAPHQLPQYASQHGLLELCRATCAELWAGRYGQQDVPRLDWRVPARAPIHRQPGGAPWTWRTATGARQHG